MLQLIWEKTNTAGNDTSTAPIRCRGAQPEMNHNKVLVQLNTLSRKNALLNREQRQEELGKNLLKEKNIISNAINRTIKKLYQPLPGNFLQCLPLTTWHILLAYKSNPKLVVDNNRTVLGLHTFLNIFQIYSNYP